MENKTNILEANVLADKIAKILAERQNTNILTIDVKEKSPVTDFFVVSSARSASQAKATLEHLEETLEEEGIFSTRKDGEKEGKWIVIDYTTVIVHIFHEEQRDFYKFERLWTEPDESNVKHYMGI